MFENIKNSIYKSISDSIKDRKKTLNLKRTDILSEPTRISKIINNVRNKHHPYLISSGEYVYLNYLFLCKDHDSFIKEKILESTLEALEEKSGNNYDEMLWGHIDWDKMFQDVIAELSKSDSSEGMGKVFEDTLVDYVPYAVIRYDELNPGYGKIYVFPDERKVKRQNAIEWVHLRHGSRLFKQAFFERFSGKTLREFDKGFDGFVKDYFMERKPDEYSFGLQAYNFHRTISQIAVHWQSLAEVQYGDMSNEKSDFKTLLEEYLKNGREQMQKLEKYQQNFDAFHIDVK